MSKEEDAEPVHGASNTPIAEWTPPPPLDDPHGPHILTPEQIEREDDYLWAIDNLELRDHYPGQWVAVHQKKVLAVGEDYLTVRAEAKAKTGLPNDKIVMAAIYDMNALLRE